MRSGALLAIITYLIWGLFPLYWPLLQPAGAVEILAHRVVWSAAVMAIGITLIRHWHLVRALTGRTWALIGAAGMLIALNWGTYIYAVNNEHVLEASLGYFIQPLVAVALGVLALRERLRPMQWIALVIAAVGVVLSALGADGFPYLSFALAISFGLYGLVKRVIDIPASLSLLGESLILLPAAVGFLLWLQARGDAHFLGYGAGHIVLTVAAGVVTAIPLLMFGAAARVLSLSILGFLQYLNPLTQFLLGVLWARESMSGPRWAGFAVIWLALIVMSVSAIRTGHRRRATQSPHTARGRGPTTNQ